MKSDINKSIFDAKKRYTSVRMQQGRVHLDSDWNEQADIVRHRIESSNADVIGRCGTPRDRECFKIEASEDQKNLRILFSPTEQTGHFYVDGVRCEIDDDALFTRQPHFPEVL